MKTLPRLIVSIVTGIGAFCATTHAAAPAVARSVADGWPARWCRAEPKMTRDQLVELMGAPTSVTDTTLSWSAYQYQFNAFVTGGGIVKQLDINTYALSAAERAALACPTVRTRPSRAKSATQSARRAAACELVTAAEMSVIVGTPLRATPNETSVGETKCVYEPASRVGPRAELAVAWGDGRAAMQGMGLAEKHERGLTKPFDGLGDQSAVAGPAVLIRDGEDLVTIVLTGVTDARPAVRRIFATAKERM